jgi:hypothetical protein
MPSRIVDPAIQAEAMREHLWRWLLDLPPLLGAAPMKEEFALAVSWLAAGERTSACCHCSMIRASGLWRHGWTRRRISRHRLSRCCR